MHVKIRTTYFTPLSSPSTIRANIWKKWEPILQTSSGNDTQHIQEPLILSPTIYYYYYF